MQGDFDRGLAPASTQAGRDYFGVIDDQYIAGIYQAWQIPNRKISEIFVDMEQAG